MMNSIILTSHNSVELSQLAWLINQNPLLKKEAGQYSLDTIVNQYIIEYWPNVTVTIKQWSTLIVSL